MVVLLSCIFATGFSATAAEDKYVIRIATFQAAGDSVGHACIKLGEILNSKGNGRIEASVVTDGEWGDQDEITEMLVQGGLVEIINATSPLPRYVPEANLQEFPYMYKDVDHQVRVLKAIGPYLSELLKPFNIKVTGSIPTGFRHFLNKEKPIYEPDDFKGLKIRAPNPMYAGMIEALGAESVTISWNEVYTALQAGVVDGMEASYSLINAMGFQEQAKYLSKTYHIASNQFFLIDNAWFNTLPEDIQKIIEESTEEASDYSVGVLKELEKEAEEQLVAQGVMINEVNDLNEFRELIIAYRENYVKKGGPGFEKLYNKILEIE